MSDSPYQEFIEINERSYPVSELTEFGFVAPLELAAGENRGSGILSFGDQKVDIEFRVRRKVKNQSMCSFTNFPIASTELVRKYLVRRDRVNSGNEELEERTYDELASGVVSSHPGQRASENAPKQESQVKSLVLMVILFVLVGLAILASFFLRSRSTLSVNNSALMGNYIPVNAKVEGAIEEVFVREGDQVEKGDVLLRLVNPEMQNMNRELAAQLATARSTVDALARQRESFVARVKFASKKIELDREVAISELEAANKARESAEAAFKRLEPYVKSGAVTQLELDEAANQLLAEESNCIAKENLVRQIEFSQQAIKGDVLVIGDRVDGELGRIDAELEIAQAKKTELETIYRLSVQREKELDVIAPRDGVVYVNYRQPGEFIKIADELVGLSYTGRSWAAGQVSAAQASRVLPGQPVKISVPTMGIKIDGTVLSVGHRAMYSKGHYNADFRGATATDVPVKVYIDDLPESIPSGIRLDMAINTGFGIEWLDKSMGYELNPIGSSPRSPAANQDAMTLASLNESSKE